MMFANYNIPQIYYVAVMDCPHETHKKNKNMPKFEFDVTIVHDLSNDNYDHFSYEDDGTLTLHLVLLILFASIFGMTVFSYYQYSKVYERYDSPHFIIALALFF